jgi:hypothetical protein
MSHPKINKIGRGDYPVMYVLRDVHTEDSNNKII